MLIALLWDVGLTARDLVMPPSKERGKASPTWGAPHPRTSQHSDWLLWVRWEFIYEPHVPRFGEGLACWQGRRVTSKTP